ncbi:MAG: DUF5777 family beta-barrel protein [Rhodothermales bacterium]
MQIWSAPRRPGKTLGIVLFLILTSIFQQASGQTLDTEELQAKAAALFQRSCSQAGCHVGPLPQMGLNLDEDNYFATLVGQPSMEQPHRLRVSPGNPDSSYLVLKLRGDPSITGLQMPFTGDKLTTEEVDTIADWITSLGDKDLSNVEPPPEPTDLPFYGWKAVNLPTTRSLTKGDFLFLIAHRFNPKLSDGYDSFYGLDGSSIIFLHLGYAITDQLMVSLARSNAVDNVELQARYNFFQQGGVRGLPVGLSLITTGNWATERGAGEKRFRKEASKFTTQVSITRAIGEQWGVAFVPGILFNAAEDVEGEDALITLGLAGRWNFHKNFSIVGDWAPVVSGFTRTTTFGNDIRFDTWGGGLEIALGGHVFQIVLSNSVGLTTDQYLRGGDLDITEGEARLGFNIFRILN